MIYHSRDQRERELRAAIQTRISRLDRGEGTVLDSEEDLQRFFGDIQMRGWQRYHDSKGDASC